MADIKIEQRGKNTALIISGEMTIECAAALKDALARSFEGAESVFVDLKNVESADLACLQLLCSAHRTSLISKKSFALTPGYPEIFKKVVKETGYSRNFGCSIESEKSCLWKGI
ncbi:MAG: STAS domain-containing protein [Nitrospirae bacterium]|nr:STAS domain-containing protein [Nitrospirota bacterium]